MLTPANSKPDSDREWLDSIKKLPQAEWARALLEKEYGDTKFARAILFASNRVCKDVLDLIPVLDLATQDELVFAENDDGETALIYAIREGLLGELIKLFDKDRLKANLLKPLAKQKKGDTALAAVMVENPEIGMSLLEKITTQELEDRANILLASGSHALWWAVLHYPEAVPLLLEKIKDYKKDDKKDEEVMRILAKSENPLMLAMRDFPEAVPFLLGQTKVFKTTDEKVKKFLAKDNKGNDALKNAIRYKPENVELLLECIKTLDKDQQAEILFAKNDYHREGGYNALTYAIRYQSEHVGLLFDWIKTLGKDQQAKILLEQQYYYGYNSLMYAIRYQPENVQPLLDLIKTLDPDKQKEIFSAKNRGGEHYYTQPSRAVPREKTPSIRSFSASGSVARPRLHYGVYDENTALLLAFFLAVQQENQNCNVEAFNILFNFILTLDLGVQAEIFLEKNRKGFSFIVLMLRYQDNSYEYGDETVLGQSLNIIKKHFPNNHQDIVNESKKDYLLAKDLNGDNTLMQALLKGSDEVQLLLDFIKTLDLDKKAEILLEKNNEDNHVLILAINKFPNCVRPLLEFIKMLDSDKQEKILLEKNKNGDNAFSLSKKKGNKECHKMLEAACVSMQISKGISALSGLGMTVQEAEKIHNSYKIFLETQGNDKRQKGQEFQNLLNGAIKSDKTKPKAKQLLIGLLKLFVSIIMPFYGIYKIYEKISTKRAVFFSSECRSLLYKIEDNAKAIIDNCEKNEQNNQVAGI